MKLPLLILIASCLRALGDDCSCDTPWNLCDDCPGGNTNDWAGTFFLIQGRDCPGGPAPHRLNLEPSCYSIACRSGQVHSGPWKSQVCHSNDILTVIFPWRCAFHTNASWPVFDYLSVTRSSVGALTTNWSGTVSFSKHGNVGVFDLSGLVPGQNFLDPLSYDELYLLLPPEYREIYSNVFTTITPLSTNTVAGTNTQFVPVTVTNPCFWCFVNADTNMLVNTNWATTDGIQVLDPVTGTNVTGPRYNAFRAGFKEAIRPKLAATKSGAYKVSGPEFSRYVIQSAPTLSGPWTNHIATFRVEVEGTNYFEPNRGFPQHYYRAITTP